ncbi:MAG: hypothetical protein ACI85V_001666 [bacterium]
MATASSNAFAIAGGIAAAGAIGAAAFLFSPTDPAPVPVQEAGLVEVVPTDEPLSKDLPADVLPSGEALSSDLLADVLSSGDVQSSDFPADVLPSGDALSNDLPADDLPSDEAQPSEASEADAASDQSTVPTPTIDTFFRSPDATTVIAGQAEPGQVIDILLSNEVVETVTAGPDGAFGTVLMIEASDQPRRLRLLADPSGDAVASLESIIIPPSEIAIVATADVSDFASQSSSVFASQSEPDEAPTIASSANDQITIGSDMASGTAPQGDGAPTVGVAVGEGAPTIAAPPTLIADADGIRILQPDVGGSSRPALIENIALDTITYDPDGEVLIAGRGANAGGFVRIYLDNQPITTSEISRDGDWRTDLPQVDTGIYTLRVDEVDAEGVVQSRIETPFKKEEPEEVAAILAEETSADGFDIAVKTVQPGATLWAIAEEKLGDGVLYVAVFEANRDLIRDPDLIYPGQVFRIPLTTE